MKKKGPVYFWIGLAVVVMFILLTDVRILLFSEYPFLYGIQDTFHSRFEETILYSPLISNAAWSHFFKIDYYGANTNQALAPYPYTILVLFNVVHSLVGNNINWAIGLIHSFIIIEYSLAYAFMRRTNIPPLVAALLALATVFYIYHFPLTLVLCLAIGSIVCTILKKNKPIFWWSGISIMLCLLALFIITLFIPLSTAFFQETEMLQQAFTHWSALASHGWQDGDVNADVYSTRFISPLLSMVVLFASFFSLVATYQRLQTKRLAVWQWFGLVFLLIANVYTYFINILLISPVLLLWIVQLKKQLLIQFGSVRWYLCLGVLLLVPFFGGIVMSSINVDYHDFFYRVALRGIQFYAQYDELSIGSEFLIAGIVLFVVYGVWYKRSDKLDFTILIYPTIYFTVIGWICFDYLVPDIIPQPSLLTRYLIPTFILALAPLFANTVKASTGKYNKIWWWLSISGTGCLVIINVLFMAAGRYNVHQVYSGPANQAIVADLHYLQPYLTATDILVSNRPQINLLAPAVLGVRTLHPNPISTLGSHESFLPQYALETKLLGDTMNQYLLTIGDIDRFGVVHELSPKSPPGVLLISQYHGIAYPLPSDWIATHQTIIKEIYHNTKVVQSLREFQTIWLYLIDEEINPEIAPYFILVASDEHHQLYRQIAPSGVVDI